MALLASGAGFREGGTATYPSATPAKGWQGEGPVAWKTALGSWSNASPALLGDLVCVHDEPVTVVCLDRARGAVRWQATNEVVDALPPAQAAELRPKLLDLQARLERLPALFAEQSQLRRDVRRDAGNADLVARLQALTQEVFATQSEAESVRPYLTPPDKEQIGYSTPSPVTDGASLFSFFANGVVSSYTPQGQRRWTVWLGEAPPEMHGYSFGVTSSPLLVDGTLVVAHDKLYGLDPATGAVRWARPGWREYGSPAVVTLGSGPVLVTPLGEVLRPRDGKVLATGLGEVWFTSPAVEGEAVWFVGGKIGKDLETHGVQAWKVRLQGSPEAVTASEQWRTSLPSKARMYASPVVSDGKLVALDDNGWWFVLDATTGTLEHHEQFKAGGPGYYPALVAAGGWVWFGVELGRLHAYEPATATLHGPFPTEPFRSTAVFDGRRTYLRTLTGLTVYERP